ncbi:MAG: DUF3108 domain-containing protein [Bryobacteraceae bacterium]
MAVFASTRRFALAGLVWLVPSALSPQSIPASETLSYSVEWRLINAGGARISISPRQDRNSQWESKLHLESSGLVSKLFKLDDNYRVEMHDQFCATGSVLDAIEGKRHHETVINFDRNTHKATYLERDLVKNAVIHRAETDIPPCVSDIVGGLYKLRTFHLEPGQNAQLPVSDGKKSVSARVEAQEREQIQTKAGAFKTIRYEVFIFNGVLFKKSGRMLLWLTDDSRKMPVQLRARMAFPIGSITFQLDKEEHS